MVCICICGKVISRPKRGRSATECADCRLKICANCGIAFRPSKWPQACCNRACGQQLRHGGGRIPHNERTRKAKRRYAETDAGGFTRHQRKKLLNQWRKKKAPCFWCGGLCETVDHVIPITRGGNSFEGNLVPACRSCNSGKRDKLVVEWRNSQNRASVVALP